MADSVLDKYNRFITDPMKHAPVLLERAKTMDLKGLPIPGFVARGFIPKIEKNPEPYLESLKKLSPERVQQFIQKNPDLFQGVSLTKGRSKMASILFDRAY
jgi:hypothetical protein